jgi:hypothetical protein
VVTSLTLERASLPHRFWNISRLRRRVFVIRLSVIRCKYRMPVSLTPALYLPTHSMVSTHAERGKRRQTFFPATRQLLPEFEYRFLCRHRSRGYPQILHSAFARDSDNGPLVYVVCKSVMNGQSGCHLNPWRS